MYEKAFIIAGFFLIAVTAQASRLYFDPASEKYVIESDSRQFVEQLAQDLSRDGSTFGPINEQGGLFSVVTDAEMGDSYGPSGSSELKFISRKNGSIVFLHSRCEPLKALRKALSEWTHRPFKEFAPFRLSNGSCAVDVTDVSPAFIQSRHWTYQSGANCFNSALRIAGLTDEVRQVESEEMSSILKSRCSRRSGAPQPGDIVVISQEGTLLHAYTFVSSQLAFEKPDQGEWNPYRYTTPAAVHEIYGVGRNGVMSSAYRCQAQ